MVSTSRVVNPRNIDLLREAIRTGAATGTFMPAVYVVEPTSRCNLKCIMCPNSRLGEDDLGDASPQDLHTTFAAIAPYAELTMLYFMGEPTLHPSFAEIAADARETLQGMLVLSTNASLMSDNIAEAIIANFDMVLVPIDRWDGATYERIRRLAVFDDVVANAERLLAVRGGRSVPAIVVKALDIVPRRGDDAATETEVEAFDRYWVERGAVPLHGWLDTWAGQMPNLVTLSRQATPYEPTSRTPCADLWFKAVINWRGEVVLCCHNWDYSVRLGRVGSDLAKTWHSKTLQRLREHHLAGDYGHETICATCREWGEPDELDAYLEPVGANLFKVF